MYLLEKTPSRNSLLPPLAGRVDRNNQLPGACDTLPSCPTFSASVRDTATHDPAILLRQKTPYAPAHKPLQAEIAAGTPSPETHDPAILLRQKTPYLHHVPVHPEFAPDTGTPVTVSPAILARCVTPFSFRQPSERDDSRSDAGSSSSAHFAPIGPAGDPVTLKPEILLRQKTPYCRPVPEQDGANGPDIGGGAAEGAAAAAAAAGGSQRSSPSSWPAGAGVHVYENPLSPSIPDPDPDRRSMAGGGGPGRQPNGAPAASGPGPAATAPSERGNLFDGACDSPHTNDQEILLRQKTPYVRRGAVFGDDDLDQAVAEAASSSTPGAGQQQQRRRQGVREQVPAEEGGTWWGGPGEDDGAEPRRNGERVPCSTDYRALKLHVADPAHVSPTAPAAYGGGGGRGAVSASARQSGAGQQQGGGGVGEGSPGLPGAVQGRVGGGSITGARQVDP